MTAATTALAVALLLAGIALDAWHDARAAAAAERDRLVQLVTTVLAVTADPDALRATLTRADPTGRLAVHLPDGRRIGAGHAPATELTRTAGHGEPRTVDTAAGRSYLHPAAVPSGGTAVIELAQPRAGFDRATATTLGRFCLLGLAAVGLAVVAADRLARPTVTQLRDLGDAAARLDGTEPAWRPPRTGVAELAAVATMINRVATLARQLVARERKMIADVSHRLRTPLTALRLDAGTLGSDPVADRIRSAVVALEHDIDDIIRAAGKPPDPIEPAVTTCDVAEVVRSRLEFWRLLAANQGRACDVSGTGGTGETGGGHEPMPVALAEDAVAAIVDALVGNVFRHTEPGTPLAVTVGRHDGWVSLVVDDGGPGIADPEAAVRRGVSGDGSTGLGLDIARTGVEATGGTIHVERGKLGGARIRLRFAEAGSDHADRQPRAWRLWPGRHLP